MRVGRCVAAAVGDTPGSASVMVDGGLVEVVDAPRVAPGPHAANIIPIAIQEMAILCFLRTMMMFPLSTMAVFGRRVCSATLLCGGYAYQ